ncbi:hypothetical protein VKT23_012725 [Stygiomarasmius scandens]|uniref:F-box domain-containing protein n=1 Tax=Marasmiellus scandens TaxID=2682957 RepID=A0ABR1J553_9AGAR
MARISRAVDAIEGKLVAFPESQGAPSLDRTVSSVPGRSKTGQLIPATPRRPQPHSNKIQRLFTEILLLLFAECASGTGNPSHSLSISINTLHLGEHGRLRHSHLPKYNVLATTLFLSQTCSRWRDLTLSTPSLWSKFHIDLVGAEKRQMKDLVRLYIARSMPAPLVLWIEAYDLTSGCAESDYYGFDDDIPDIPESNELVPASYIGFFGRSILGLFIKESTRWKRLCLDLPTSLFNGVLGPLSRDLPEPGSYSHLYQSLQELELFWDYHHDSFAAGPFSVDFRNAPKLRSLTLTEFPFTSHSDCNLPLNLITTLVLYVSPTWPSLVQIFRLCPRLEKVFLFAGPQHDPETDTEEHDENQGELQKQYLKHSDLTCLKLEIESFATAAAICAALHVPSLTSLELDSSAYSHGGEVLKINSWLQSLQKLMEHCTRLDRFSFIDDRTSDPVFVTDNILSVLASGSTLTEVELRMPCSILNNCLFESLTVSEQTSTILPRLRDLRIEIIILADGWDFLPDPDIILSMLSSRTSPNTSINASSDMEVSVLESFSLGVFTDAEALARGLGVINRVCAWAKDFRSAVEPGLRELARGGLKVRLDLGKE